MKIIILPLLVAISSATAQEGPVLGTPRIEKEIRQSSVLAETMAKKLDSLIIPEVNCKNDTLLNSISKVEQLIRSSTPEKEGIHIVTRVKEGQDNLRITFSMKNATLRQVLSEIGKQSELKVRPDPYAISLL